MAQATKAIHDDNIRALAYKIWEDEGRPHGRDEEHWLRATAAFENVAVLKPVTVTAEKPAKKAKGKR